MGLAVLDEVVEPLCDDHGPAFAASGVGFFVGGEAFVGEG